MASYYDVVVGDKVNRAAAWFYPNPSAAADRIKGRVAFWHGVRIERSGDNQSVPSTDFQLETDAGARSWLEAHPSAEPRVIAYDVRRCCGGGKICRVNVRELSGKDDPNEYASGTLEDGTKFLIDRRAAARLPSRFGLTVRGLGPLRHLDLNLDCEQWGALLYD